MESLIENMSDARLDQRFPERMLARLFPHESVRKRPEQCFIHRRDDHEKSD